MKLPMPAKIHSILLVDDDQTATRALQKLLERDGYEVKTTHDGEMALAMAEEFQLDAIILDIDIPKKNGYEVAHALKHASHAAPLLIALSGYGQKEDKRMARNAGFDHHLTKPILVSEIEQLFGSARIKDVSK